MDSLFWNLILNISLLVMVVHLLTSIKLVRHILLEHQGNMGRQMLLAVFFGVMCIFSTHIGLPVNGVIVNTRVISVLAASMIGGPWIGLVAAAIGSIHRYFYGGFTAVACAISTIVAGILGALVFPQMRDGKRRNLKAMVTTAVAEGLHMLIILLVCRPFDLAVEMVSSIAMPIILLNTFGMLMFLAAFDNVFWEEDLQSAERFHQAFSVAERCLPYLRSGLSDQENLKNAVQIILSQGLCPGVMITDKHQILAKGAAPSDQGLAELEAFPEAARLAIGKKQIVRTEYSIQERSTARTYLVLAAPLTVMDQPIGALVVFLKKQRLSPRANQSFVEGLALLFSTQLELSELEYQKRLRRRAELKVLQSQINPHFLHNALNTISYITREDPEKARELLLALSLYFRQTLNAEQDMVSLADEISHVSNYLQIEKARFEDRLQVTVDIPAEIQVFLPPFMLQPIVENAVKYGSDSSGMRSVVICAQKQEEGVAIRVSDRGPGFPENIAEMLEAEGRTDHYGLRNVHQRLKSIYGEDAGLRITSTPTGSTVEFLIPSLDESEQKRRNCADANRNH